MNRDGKSLHDRIHGEMIDSFDEELELEIDDDRLDKLLADLAEHPERETIDRRFYFKELFRLQGELVKLQDWVRHGEVVLPPRVHHPDYHRGPIPKEMYVPAVY